MEITVEGVSDPDGDSVSVTVTAVTQDEGVVGPQERRSCPDAVLVGGGRVRVRAERTGRGDGRVYHVAFTADDGRSGSCTGTVTVCVPHDQGRGRICGDQGPVADSTDAACPGACDDADTCSVEACFPTTGRLDTPRMRFAAVTCAFAQARLASTCDAVPATIRRPFERARRLVTRGASEAGPRRARRLVAHAARMLVRAAERLPLLEARGRLSAECSAALREVLMDASERAERWLGSG